ncbi:MAG TPA: hypothetical protein VHN98_05410 [Acidimicrobiales bacterium]|nr:hypothetical protein [Acidimicrobiales bacterium]
MALSTEVRKHHTAWLSRNGEAPVPVRYGVTDEELVVFADGRLAGIRAGDRLTATIHKIAFGEPICEVAVTARELAPAEVPLWLVADVAGNHPILNSGRKHPYEELRSTRRLVALKP